MSVYLKCFQPPRAETADKPYSEALTSFDANEDVSRACARMRTILEPIAGNMDTIEAGSPK
jgi:hypothetical protein